MVRDPRERDDPLSGRLFWPRTGGRDISAEVDYDRPCPECGSLGGWGLEDEPIAWDDEQNFGAFIRSCATAIFNPHLLARHIWRQVRMDLPAARRFRRIVLAIATISLCVVTFTLTGRALNLGAACAAL